MRYTKRILFAATVLLCAAGSSGQTLDDLNLQVHGYATQGFIYTSANNWNTTNSSDSSVAWTEAVVNLTVQPQSKLRVGIQARYSLLGSLGNTITLDWAQADYKFNEQFGFRAGKVKTPTGLLNESQDIDPAQLWILLPQSVYPLASRDSLLAHYGGVIYGQVALGERLGKLEYRGYGGERVLAGDDGYFEGLRSAGLSLPNGTTGSIFGGTLRWNTPVHGLMVGATEAFMNASGELIAGPYQGTITVPRIASPYFFAKYEHSRVMISGEYNRLALLATAPLAGFPTVYNPFDQRSFYAMASYRATPKLSGGLYYSSSIDHKAAFPSSHYQKDWALTARYDFNSFVYAKAEQHWMDGTELGFFASNNSNLQLSTRMTLLKLGVSF
jgi:hypothetical protein